MKQEDYRAAMRMLREAINRMLDLAENRLLSFSDIEPVVKAVEAAENIITSDYIGEE